MAIFLRGDAAPGCAAPAKGAAKSPVPTADKKSRRFQCMNSSAEGVRGPGQSVANHNSA
jgi:hypothetical protein